MSLAELQRCFWLSVRTRGAPPVGLEATFTASARQSAAERLGVYHVAYWQRQLRVLASTFPKLQASLGERRFEQCALRYIERCPAVHPCIERLGENLPHFLAESGGLSDSDIGLARLEWASVACLLAPDPPRRQEPQGELGARFALGRLELIPALQVVRAPAPAVRAFDQSLELAPPLAEPSIAFFRPAFAVRYVVLGEDEASALALARAGQSVAKVCEAFLGEHEIATQRALSVLESWFSRGWVAGVRLDAEREVTTTTAPA